MSAQTISPPLPPITEKTPQIPVVPESPVKVSVEEYLQRERQSDTRHEYVDGEIIAMAGESPTHNRIARNICVHFEIAFAERPCESFIENIRVRVTPTQYRYPDVVALCGEAQFDADNPPALLNPAVIIEVLSPSTQGFDREEKFMEYRQLPCVTDYVLAAQDQPLVVHYARQTATSWALNEFTDLTGTLGFTSLGITLPLSDIYRKIVFAPVESSVPAEPAS